MKYSTASAVGLGTLSGEKLITTENLTTDKPLSLVI